MPPRSSGIDLKAACALLEAGVKRGTGFLVSADRLLTCHHVVSDVDDAPIQVIFSHGCYEATVELADVTNDCALLLLKQPVPSASAQPLTLSTETISRGSTWEGYGFPAATGQAGLLIEGKVQDPTGQDPGLRPAVVLHSPNVTAGSWLAGFSGSPVLIGGKVAGQLRKIIPDQSGGAQLAVVYACPAGILADLTQHRLSTASWPTANPYRGLSSFQPEDAPVFFGRDELTERLWQRFNAMYQSLGQRRLLAVLGPSGSGKSSVTLAGLVPRLRVQLGSSSRPPRIILLRPGDRLIESLARSLVPLLPADNTVLSASRQLAIEKLLRSQEAPAEGLRRFATDLPDIAAAPLIVVVDQFEEVYALCKDPAERNTFVDLLLHAASDVNRQVSIVITLRSDFLGETQRQHPELNRCIAAQLELVPAMSREELRHVIAEPARQAGRPLDIATVDLLLLQAASGENTLPLLEFALTRIWEGLCQGKAPATTLEELGGVGGALACQAQSIYQSLSTAEQASARRAFLRLVKLGEGTRDTRQRIAIAELCGRGETELHVLGVLRHFAGKEGRLVTLSGDAQQATAEVTHEALFDNWQALREWIDESRTDRSFHERVAGAARLWHEAGRPAGRLWRSPDLDLLRSYYVRKPDDLNSTQAEFLTAASNQQQREWLLAWASRLSVLFAVLLVSGVYVMKESQRMRQMREAAEKTRRQLQNAYVEQGRHSLIEEDRPSEGLLWLHRAYSQGAKHPMLSYLLAEATRFPDAVQALLVGHTGGLTDASFSRDGRRLVTASEDRTARVWDTRTGRLLALLNGHSGSVLSATFSPDGQRILTASNDGTAGIWNADSGMLLFLLKGHEMPVWTARYSADGRRIVTASSDRTARTWDADTGAPLAVLQGHIDSVGAANYSIDSRRIITASYDRTARVWDADSGKELALLMGHSDRVATAIFAPDGRRVITTSYDKTARIWDASSGQALVRLLGHGDRVGSVSYSPDGRRIVTGSHDKTARVWDAETGSLLHLLEGHRGTITSVKFSPDGRRIVTGSLDGTARIWESDDGKVAAVLQGHGYSVARANFSPDSHSVVTASQDKTARIWSTDSSQVLATLEGHEAKVGAACFNPDGQRIVTASADQVARVWELKSGKPVLLLRGHEDRVISAAYSPNGQHIVTASQDKSARIWDAESGKPVAILQGHSAAVMCASYSPSGQRIATASLDNTARIWDASTGKLITVLRGPDISGLSVSFSPDGGRVVTASQDNTALVWDVKSSKPLTLLRGHGDIIRTAQFSPDGRRIVTASQDSTARVWDAESGTVLALLPGHTEAVLSARFSPDGRRIVTASVDKTARIYEADSAKILAVLRGHAAVIATAEFSPDGRRIVTASYDKTARVWDALPETRTPEQLEKLILCRIAFKFASPDSDVIVPAEPDIAACANLVPRAISH